MRLALVSGANRGLGKEICRQLLYQGCSVIMTARDLKNALCARKEIIESEIEDISHRIIAMELDVTSEKSIENIQKILHKKSLFNISILINNAGIYLDNPRNSEFHSFLDIPLDILQKTLETNLFGAIRLTQIFLPEMMKNGYGRIVNIASGMGRSVELDKFAPYYRISKTSLIAFTKIASDTCRTHGDILINAVCPGWVQTDMGGREAVRTVEEGARGVVLAALLGEDGPSGHLLRDGKIFDWEEATVGCCPLNKTIFQI